MRKSEPIDYEVPTVPPGVYRRQWRAYHFQVGAVAFVFIAGAFATGIVAAVIQKLTGSRLAGALVFVAWIAVLIMTMLRTAFWRCPRCGKPFHSRPGLTNAFARKCLNCGLPWGAGR